MACMPVLTELSCGLFGIKIRKLEFLSVYLPHATNYLHQNLCWGTLLKFAAIFQH
jgi:hypothetical protein